MLKEKDFIFPREELCHAAHGNLVSLIVVANQFMQESKLEVAAFWRFVGQKFSAGWTDVAKGDIEEVARRISRNMASCGANLQTVECDAQLVQLVFSGWPPAWAVEAWDSSIQEAAPMCEVFRSITNSLGYDYKWQLEDGFITMIVQRPEGQHDNE